MVRVFTNYTLLQVLIMPYLFVVLRIAYNKHVYAEIERAVKANSLNVKFTKVGDIAEMISNNIMTTPAVVVDGVARLKGHVPTESEGIVNMKH